MQAYELAQLIGERQAAGRPYLEFLRAPSLSLGLYHLPAGGLDPQQPHTEDEVYLVVNGRGQIRVGGQDRAIGPGAVIFVPARVEHRFHAITDDLDLLVFFAPAEKTADDGR
jgi:mannose-6-phosphate isomerase-like protein (cupin superfamily)